MLHPPDPTTPNGKRVLCTGFVGYDQSYEFDPMFECRDSIHDVHTKYPHQLTNLFENRWKEGNNS